MSEQFNNTIELPKARVIGDITSEKLMPWREKGIKISLKAIFYDNEGRISIYLSDKPKHTKDGERIENFAGGGHNKDESSIEWLRRELEEEVNTSSLATESINDNLPVIASGVVNSLKENKQKGVFLTAIKVDSLESITPKKHELDHMQIFKNSMELIKWLDDTDTPSDVKALYSLAVQKLPYSS
jgi:hypothetical protein